MDRCFLPLSARTLSLLLGGVLLAAAARAASLRRLCPALPASRATRSICARARPIAIRSSGSITAAACPSKSSPNMTCGGRFATRTARQAGYMPRWSPSGGPIVVTAAKPAPVRRSDDPRSPILALAQNGVVAKLEACEAVACEIVASATRRLDRKKEHMGSAGWRSIPVTKALHRAVIAAFERRVISSDAGCGACPAIRRRQPRTNALGLVAIASCAARRFGDGRRRGASARTDLLGGLRLGPQSLCAPRHDLSFRALFRAGCRRQWREGAGDVGRRSLQSAA